MEWIYIAQSMSVADCCQHVVEREYEFLVAVLIVTEKLDMRSAFIYGSWTTCHWKSRNYALPKRL